MLLWSAIPDLTVHSGGQYLLSHHSPLSSRSSALIIQNNLLIPAVCFLAIALASTILIFPQSLHSIVMTQLTETCFTPIKALLDLQEPILATSTLNRETWDGLAQKAYGLRKAHVMGVAGVDGQIKLLGLEISRGRLSAVDLVRVVEKGKELGARAYSLASFVVSLKPMLFSATMSVLTHQMILDERAKALSKLSETADAHHKRRKQYIQNIADNQHPGTAIYDLLPILSSSTAPLRSASSDALSEIMAYLNGVNHSRWGKLKASNTQVRQESFARLQVALSQYKSHDSIALLEPFRNTFDSTGHLRPELIGKMRYSARDLFTCYLLTTSLTAFAQVLVELMELVLKLEEASPGNKWNFPANIKKAISDNAMDKNGGSPLDMRREASEETLVDRDGDEQTGKQAKKAAKQTKKEAMNKGKKRWGESAKHPRTLLPMQGRREGS